MNISPKSTEGGGTRFSGWRLIYTLHLPARATPGATARAEPGKCSGDDDARRTSSISRERCTEQQSIDVKLKS